MRIFATVLRARPLEEKIAAMRAFEAQVVPLLARGIVKPIVDRVLPLAEAATRARVHGQQRRLRQDRAHRMKLGIDFGTTRTVVAAVEDGRHPVAAFDEAGEYRAYIPGIAALRGGELLLGWEAARRWPTATYDHAIRSIKREIQTRMPDDEVPAAASPRSSSSRASSIDFGPR